MYRDCKGKKKEFWWCLQTPKNIYVFLFFFFGFARCFVMSNIFSYLNQMKRKKLSLSGAQHVFVNTHQLKCFFQAKTCKNYHSLWILSMHNGLMAGFFLRRSYGRHIYVIRFFFGFKKDTAFGGINVTTLHIHWKVFTLYS